MKATKTKLVSLLLVMILALTLVTGCEKKEVVTDNNNGSNVTDNSNFVETDGEDNENYNGKLVFEHSIELKYAKNFSVDYYKGGYKLIKISDGRQFLTIPEGMSIPEEKGEDVVALQMPINNMLVSSNPTVSLINAIGMLDRVKLVTTDVDSWYIQEVKDKMTKDDIKYVGEYKAPDYEMITSINPQLSIFSTMLSSVPEVEEKLKELNIPVLVDQSPYEENPLARVEWAKLYGALFDCEEKAENVFNEQVAYVDDLHITEQSDKTVSIFYITSKGVLYARRGGDYMSKMVELAGGKYVFADLEADKTGTVKMEFEDFYATAKDCDYIIYVWSLGGKPETLADFTAKNELFADLKAVKDENVWCTTPDYFQISDTIGYMIKDINGMLNLEDNSIDKLTYLFKLK